MFKLLALLFIRDCNNCVNISIGVYSTNGQISSILKTVLLQNLILLGVFRITVEYFYLKTLFPYRKKLSESSWFSAQKDERIFV